MNDTTAIIISFLRPAYTVACVESLRKTYPDIHILVGDNGGDDGSVAKACEANGARMIPLPFDSGVCYARNRLVELVETPFVMVGDDDFFYDEDAKADSMAAFLRTHEEYDLIGGRVRVSGVVQNYQGRTERVGRSFRSHPIDVDTQEFSLFPAIPGQAELRYCSADLTFNYFVARTDKVRQVPWDEQIKVAYEHFSWFWDFKQAGGKVAFTPDAIVIHKPEHIRAKVYGDPSHQKYMEYRNRRNDKERFFSRYNIEFTIGMNGRRTDSPFAGLEKKNENTVKHVDFCVTTIKRPKELRRLLLSIATYYPMANIYVADQNERFDTAYYRKLKDELRQAGLVQRPIFESLPYDCGVSYARNHLMRTTPNKYKLILDDDMVFTEETNIGRMVYLLNAFPNAGVVGGRMTQGGVSVHYEFELEIENDMIVQKPDREPYRTLNNSQGSVRYRRTGCVLNFALFRSDVFQHIQWDPRLKVTEHTDFYLAWKRLPYTVIYTPDVVVDHPPGPRPPEYKELRGRDEFLHLMLNKHKVRGMRYLNGQVHELDGAGGIKRYKIHT